jgi:hypothetical protein
MRQLPRQRLLLRLPAGRRTEPGSGQRSLRLRDPLRMRVCRVRLLVP